MAINSATENRAQKSEEEEAAKPELVRKYRRVGPAAINAALLCKPKQKKEEPKPSYEPREDEI